MTRNNLTTLNRIKYKDLAIAVVLSGASLLLFPATTKAATNDDTSNNSTTPSSTLVQKSTTAAPIDRKTVGSITPPTLNQNTTTESVNSTSSNNQTNMNNSSSINNTTSSNTSNNEDTANPITSKTATDTNSSPSSINSINNNDSQITDSSVTTPTPTSTSTVVSPTTTQEQTSTYTIDNTGNLTSAYKIPDSGISITTDTNTKPNSTGQYKVILQGVTNDGTVLGAAKTVAIIFPNSSVTFNPKVLTTELAQNMGSAYNTYIPLDKNYSTDITSINMDNGNITISVYFEDPTVNVDYKFMDENTDKEITDESRTYDYKNDPSLKNGIKVPQAVKTDAGFNIVDNSGYSDNTTTSVPYFGPNGMILNNSHYILDTTKSNGITPLDTMQYPADDNNATVTDEFWYKEANAPTMTVNATDQFGNVIKTFNNSTISAIPTTVTAKDVLPSTTDTDITNNDLDDITVTETNSVSGQADKTTTYQVTPSDYASLLASTKTYDSRDIGDYQNVNVQLGYTTTSVPLYIQPTDPSGNKIGDPIATGTGVIGQNDTILAPTINGYSPSAPSESVTVTQNQGPIDFPYISATDINPNDHGSYLYDGKFSSIPSSGIQAVNTGNANTDSTAKHSISIQAVDTDGNPLGNSIPVSSTSTNTTYSLNWSPDLVKNLNNSIKNASQYEPWNKDLNGQLNIPVTNKDVVVDVIYALPKVTTTYNYIDENTGKSLLTQTNTWNLDDPTNGSTFKSQGIRPPMTIIDSDSGQLAADDLSPTPQTNPADLPFFGPAGTVFNTGQYQLDSVKSNMTTPIRYITWPSSDVTKTFYYTENPDPTITLDAVNQAGKVIKTFNAPTVVSTLPAPQLSPAVDFPTIDQAKINGYTLTGIQVHATGSYFGGTDTDYSYSLTPAQYADFISSTSAQSTMDERAIAAHANFGIHFTYTGNSVPLTVQPVDEFGNKIGNPISVGTGIVGSDATLKAPELANYKAVNGTSTVTVDPNQNIFEIPYTRITSDTGNTSSGTFTEPNTTTNSNSTTSPSINNTSTTHNTDNTSSSTAKTNTGSSTSNSITNQNTDQSNSHSVAEPNTNVSSSNSTIDNTGNISSHSTIKHTTKNTNSITSAQIDNSDSSANNLNTNSPADHVKNNYSSHPEIVATIDQTKYTESVNTNKLSQKNEATPQISSVQNNSNNNPKTTTKHSQINLINSQFTKTDLQAKLPQTGNKLSALLSAVGLAILGIMGFCLKKIKKII